jgi:hypothetical protein
MTAKWSDEILHRHADGREHAHKGSQGFTIGNQVIEDRLGDDPQHSHSTLGGGNESGPVVWSERLGDIASV